MSDLGDKLREIVGQETTPPLWIYVTKDQVPTLARAAVELDNAESAFVRGILFGAFSMQGRHEEAAALIHQQTGVGRKDMNHRWSGWPGAWCLDCGKSDPVEQALADGKTDDEGRILPDALTDEDKAPCPGPGSKRHDPYAKR